ncbi:RAMP superfamily CRISPR-associated protein [Fibrobacter sp.]|uniref:RAMP superfamily CRISPR-associated protein n=1 Tax=Fibrobacter sp. TaxID=35828 RepID=UPI0025C5BBAF|nr:RAMP superfamily CRISPR-associated protein [Fibrobacter sp.]MBS7272352.1 CRISPR-associated protein [Fibrobacter sp.]
MKSFARSNNFRYLARVVLQAETPVVIGSGDKDSLTDSLVQKDVNGLPYIPASSVAGCLRHAFASKLDVKELERVFGYQKSDDGQGSRVIFTDGRLVGPNGVVDGIQNINFDTDAFFSRFATLPVRDHVRISHHGAAEKTGKFDEEIVFKGSRFCFEIELVGESNDAQYFDTLLEQMMHSEFRIGAGSRSGFGKVKIVELKKMTLDLTNGENLEKYIAKSSDLFDPTGFWKDVPKERNQVLNTDGWTSYKLELTPRDFFLFAAGSGENDADICAVRASQIEWNDGKPVFTPNLLLIPGSSVKGAISHRVAYRYNKRMGVTLETLKEIADATNKDIFDLVKEYTGCKNKAVQTLFGSQDKDYSCRGRVLVSDVIQQKSSTKMLNHVSVDRFTGGAVAGALFSERVWSKESSEKPYALEFLLEPGEVDADVLGAFEDALKDIAKGMLPLGGGVNRGHGIFEGKVYKNGEVL